MLNLRRGTGMVALIVIAGCGSSSGGPTPPTTPPTPTPSGPVTVAVTGTTHQPAINSCTGDSHAFTAAAGEIRVSLTATNDPNGSLSVQVCSGTTDSGSNCAIRQQRIAVGETLVGTRVGAAGQTLKFLPFACVFTSTQGITPITYAASLTYQQ